MREFYIENGESFRERKKRVSDISDRILEICAIILNKVCVNFIYIEIQKL